jgi:zinc transporter, ZIP family
MLESLLWGATASAMLLAGAAIAYLSRPSPRLNAAVIAVGAGLLLGSVANDLIEDALRSSSLLLVTAAFFLGSATFLIGDLLLDRLGAAKREDSTGGQADGSARFSPKSHCPVGVIVRMALAHVVFLEKGWLDSARRD